MDLSSFYRIACDNFISFCGNGLFVILAFVVIVALAIVEKDKKLRTMLVSYPIFCLIIFAFPLWSLYTSREDDSEILYRILWLIPFSGIVCYGLVKLVFSYEGKKRFALFAGSVLLIVLSGRFIYSNSLFQKAENKYHVPETVVKICDEIIVPGREIRAAFPVEFVSYVRQYTPLIYLPVGREALMFAETGQVRLFEEMNKDEINVEVLVEELHKTDTPYFVVSSQKKFIGSLSSYDFVYVTTIDDYDIYLDNNAYIGIDDIDYR